MWAKARKCKTSEAAVPSWWVISSVCAPPMSYISVPSLAHEVILKRLKRLGDLVPPGALEARSGLRGLSLATLDSFELSVSPVRPTVRMISRLGGPTPAGSSPGASDPPARARAEAGGGNDGVGRRRDTRARIGRVGRIERSAGLGSSPRQVACARAGPRGCRLAPAPDPPGPTASSWSASLFVG